ncbi:MAG: hypothetical protein QOH68_1745 [Nocardioidaceae bacterium]|jgi:hypothetical protein|nr:hypothetical protein [Nocardioidaceae bacterium]
MERVLLPPVTAPKDASIGGAFGCFVAAIVATAGVALMVYGAIQFWHQVLHR